MPEVQRTLLWQRLDGPGTEYFGLWRDGSGWQFRGTVIAALDGPLRARYGVIVDGEWRTRAVHVGLRQSGPERVLHLAVEGGSWFQGKDELEELRGCVDVDLGITPSTNTLPIRRLCLAAGESAELQVAWVRFPGLTVERATQRYTCLDAYCYRYESATYSAELEVDDLGLVVAYGEWKRC